MSCESPTRELVTFWIAGTLGPADAAAVAAHVDTCAECRAAALDGLRNIRGFQDLHLRSNEIVAAAAGNLLSPHLLVCSKCREDVALLRSVNSDLAAAERAAAFDHITGGEPGPPARANWMRSPMVALALAATLVVVIGGVILSRRGVDDQTRLRGGAAAAVEQPTTATGADGVPTFAWTPASGATRYRVALFTADGRPQWTREVEAPPLRWPADEPRPAGSYRWRVEALKAGAVLARSRLAEIEVAK